MVNGDEKNKSPCGSYLKYKYILKERIHMSEKDICEKASELLNLELSKLLSGEYSVKQIATELDRRYNVYDKYGRILIESPIVLYSCIIKNNKTGDVSHVDGELAKRIYDKYIDCINFVKEGD